MVTAIDVIVPVKLVLTMKITVPSAPTVFLKLKFLVNAIDVLKSVSHVVTLLIVRPVSRVMLYMIPYAKNARMTIVTIAR